MPLDQIADFQDRVRAGRPLRIRGGGSKDWYGQRLEGDILDTRGYAGIVDYEPTELVITARCGTPLSEVEAALAEQRQMLAFEPPHFGPGATIGGTVACGLCGPRRATSGATRDFVLGAKLLDGKGDVLSFGGRVMKNVAGYDVSRMLAGSLGTLGLILEVSLKVLPRPFAESTLRFELGEADAIRRLNEWGGRPLPISGSWWHDGVLALRLSGAEAAVTAARRALGGDEIPEAAAFWTGVREQRLPFFGGSEALWRLSLPSTAGAIALSSAQAIEWGGAHRWLRADSDAAFAQAIRRIAEDCGGHATLFRGGDKSVGVFHPPAPALGAIGARMRAAFDPHHIFNRGRMFLQRED
ncbi:glycolate oxidase subunit GlcE [Massilia sp.]|uniref:glycolate oxidase subunit GlcE n=1 Tax=Massilia sp. TaxID=1882437 RepID=UPI00289F2304|nr:glycolate oxidase subunit GlcE [Massilia sp.]